MPSLRPPSSMQLKNLRAGQERRRFERFSPQRVNRCRVLPEEGAVLKGAVLDVSVRGAGLLLRGSLRPGHPITLVLKGGWLSLSVPARVVYCTEQSPGCTLVGCEFLGVLSEADLMRLVRA